jgi:hypothetical protein
MNPLRATGRSDSWWGEAPEGPIDSTKAIRKNLPDVVSKAEKSCRAVTHDKATARRGSWPNHGIGHEPPEASLYRSRHSGASPHQRDLAPRAHSPQLTIAASFNIVFQLRPVPGPPRCFSISFAVNLDCPTPAG